MKGISEFAREKMVSTAAVSNHLKRYKEELKGHIIQQGRRKYLDDIAIKFLSEKIIGSKFVIYDAKKDEEIKQLRDENKKLNQHLIKTQHDFLQLQEKTHALEIEKMCIEGEIQSLHERRLTLKERISGRLKNRG